MTIYQTKMIEKAAVLRDLAQQGIREMTALYDDTGSIRAQDVERITELHNKAMMLSEAARKVRG